MLVSGSISSERALHANPLKVIDSDDGGAFLLGRLGVSGSATERTCGDGVRIGRHWLHSSS